MNENLQIVFGLLGGLALFLYGMFLMSASLQKAAGERMRSILAVLTKNPVMGVLAGALVTAVLQSSSATTVMAIGFVSAGLLNLPQAISIIFGANIGTTITAQIIAFKLSDYIEIIIFIGFIIGFVAKNEKMKSIGNSIFAFGVLFLGIETMGSVMKPLAKSELFVHLIERVADHPFLGVAVGTLMTLVVQSSSATIAVLQNFASQAGPDGVHSILGLAGALPILLGDNIGTTITALLATIGQSRDAKRTAIAHCIFNISGAAIFIWFVKPYAYLIQQLSTKGPEIEVISRQIANAHTGFNIIMTCVWLGLIGLMVKIVTTLIPDAPQPVNDMARPIYIDAHLISQPTAALQLVGKEIGRLSSYVSETIEDVIQLVKTDKMKHYHAAVEHVTALRKLSAAINDYMVEMFSRGTLTGNQSAECTNLMVVLGDIERVYNNTLNVADTMKMKIEAQYDYSEEATEDLYTYLKTINKVFLLSVVAIETGDQSQISKIIKQRDKILGLNLKARKRHVHRINQGKCKHGHHSDAFADMLLQLDRMGNSCVNLADVALNRNDFSSFQSVINEQEPMETSVV